MCWLDCGVASTFVIPDVTGRLLGRNYLQHYHPFRHQLMKINYGYNGCVQSRKLTNTVNDNWANEN